MALKACLAMGNTFTFVTEFKIHFKNGAEEADLNASALVLCSFSKFD